METRLQLLCFSSSDLEILRLVVNCVVNNHLYDFMSAVKTTCRVYSPLYLELAYPKALLPYLDS